MKNRKLKLFILVVVTPLTFYQSKCNQCQQDVLCDLLTNAAEWYDGLSDVNAGSIVKMAIKVINEVDAFNDCKTLNANPTDYGTQIYHRTSASSQWNSIGTATYGQEGIEAGKAFSDYPEVTFIVPGQYYFKSVADKSNTILERSETNNENSSIEKRARSKSSTVVSSGILTVSASPEYMNVLRNSLEPVPYFKVMPKSNLISFQVEPFRQ